MSTFLDLVNDVIAESKQALDPLTSATFAAPPRTVLYTRMKGWVRQSYVDLLEERREWFFSSERGVVTIQPRLHLAQLAGGYTPAVGDELVGEISGSTMEITEVLPVDEGREAGNERTVSVVYTDDSRGDNLDQWEKFTAVRGATVFASAGRIENRGTYDFSHYLPTLDTINQNSVSIKRSVDDPEFTGGTSSEMLPLRYIDWPQFYARYRNFYSNAGTPSYVSRGPDGYLDFYPRPDGLYDVAFEYEQKPNDLILWSDTPLLLPDKHHKLLVWKTLIELADFNNDRALFARANKKYQERLGWLMRDYLPEMRFDTSQFYRW